MKNHLSTSLILFITILLIAPTAHAQSKRTIHLKDGSVLRGELLQLKNGTYTIKTKTLGTFDLPESRISNISDANQSLNQNNQTQKSDKTQGQQPLQQSLTSAMNKMPPEAKAMQGVLLSDPELMQDIQSLAADPEIAALLSDPALMQAVMGGDINSIGNNRKAQSLMQNPKIKRMIDKVGNKMNVPK